MKTPTFFDLLHLGPQWFDSERVITRPPGYSAPHSVALVRAVLARDVGRNGEAPAEDPARASRRRVRELALR